jgi:hypothetical protein
MLSSFGKVVLSRQGTPGGSQDWLPHEQKLIICLVTVAAASAATTTATVAAPTTAAAAPVFFGTRFVDVQRSTVEITAVEFGYSAIRLGGIVHFDESKATGLARVAVGDEIYAPHGAVSFKHGSNCIFGRSEA